jgi:hypothetical protein
MAAISILGMVQGCRMVYFQTKKNKLGKFWRALEGKSLVYYMAIWNILRPFGTFYGHLAIQWKFGTLCLEKSGNPGMVSIFKSQFEIVA